MALVIQIKKEQRIIINGAVLENVSGRTVAIAVKNEAAILRSEDVLTADAAVTPARRVYFALQCAYLFPDRKDEHLRDFEQFLVSYLEAAPSAREIAACSRRRWGRQLLRRAQAGSAIDRTRRRTSRTRKKCYQCTYNLISCISEATRVTVCDGWKRNFRHTLLLE
jgi:flagellar protein FlbT